MTTLQRLIRVYKDSAKLGLDTNVTRKWLIKRTGEKPGKGWMKRVSAIAKASHEHPLTGLCGNLHEKDMRRVICGNCYEGNQA